MGGKSIRANEYCLTHDGDPQKSSAAGCSATNSTLQSLHRPPRNIFAAETVLPFDRINSLYKTIKVKAKETGVIFSGLKGLRKVRGGVGSSAALKGGEKEGLFFIDEQKETM